MLVLSRTEVPVQGTDSSREQVPEARNVLVGLARGLFGAIAPERVADHVLAIARDADWPVQRAALSALARRYRFAQRDELRVAERPERGQVLGVYRTHGTSDKRGGVRPYETALLSLAPLRLSCACADFVRSSLGLCKHGLVVLEALERKRVLGSGAAVAQVEKRSALVWDPAHPLRGNADRLARIAYVQRRGRTSLLATLGQGRPDPKMLRDPERRLAFIATLERALRSASVIADPAIRTLLSEERERSERRLMAERGLREAMQTLSGLARKLYPYQKEGVKRFFASGRLLLADDMGLGKTTQAIAACHGLFASGRVARGLLIVPAALKPQWRREWEATTATPLVLVEGSPQERARLYRSVKRGFLLIGYEQLLRDFREVQRLAPEFVVLDEAQRIKNWATKSAAYVKALSPAYRLVLTGTPMENRFDELASIMDFVDDLALEPKWRLAPFHTIEQGNSHRGAGGARHLDVLRERLSGSMLRRIRKEVLAQLPARTDTRVPVELTAVQRREHDELNQPIAVLASKAARRPLTPPEFLQLMQMLTTQRMICNGMVQLRFEEEWPRVQRLTPTPALLEGLFAPKLLALRNLLEQLVVEQGRKVVVFSQWRKMLRFSEWAVRDLLHAEGKRAVFFTGAESAGLRERSIVDFHDDPSAAMMFLSDAGGVGLNLQRAASCCINLELPWNPAVLEQRVGRIYRLGQTLPVDVYNLVSEKGIEARIAELVQQKSAVFSSLFDGTTEEVRFEGQSSFLQTVRKLVEPVELPSAEAEDEEPLVAENASECEPIAVARSQAGAHEQAGAATGVQPALARAADETIEDAPASSARGFKVERLPDGGVRIEAPPELAAPLADLFESLTRALRTSLPGASP